MDKAAYAVEAGAEASHWWFVGRRRLLADLIERRGVRADARVLDIGTSTGTNLRLLKELGFTRVSGLDSSDEAIRWCAEKGLGRVEKGDACNLPFGEGEFQLVLATDVIEHVDDDARAISEIRRVLAPGGTAIISVPAFPYLWGTHDEVSHHKRRYRRGPLLGLLRRGGLICAESFYFNYLLFFPIWAARRLMKPLKVRVESENSLNTPLLNRILTGIFLMDIATARIVRPPFGVSIVAVTTRE